MSWFIRAVFALAVVLSAFDAVAAPPAAYWRDIEDGEIAARSARQVVPQRYRVVALDEPLLRALLAGAPAESAAAARNSPLEVALPAPDGGVARFRVVDSPIMEPALAAKYPSIRTYAGQGIDDPTATLRFDLTPAGFRAQVLSADGSWYIDPYQPGDSVHHIAYARADLTREPALRSCTVLGEPSAAHDAPKHFAPHLAPPKVSSGATLRTYRLAVAATGEYTTFHGGTVANGLGAIVSTMNRVNGLYEREVAVRMVLVANNDLIVYTNGATDPYTNNNGQTLLGENQSNIDAVIGSANYDIGHVFSTGGGGIALLGSVCANGGKARGVTGSGAPVGDPYDVDYVAHEMGHQFNAPHTYNSTVGSCNGNRSGGAAYETGSGVTIMAYAGICGAENLQPNSEDYFHRDSLNRILAFTTSGGGASCGTTAPTGNQPPTVAAPATTTIPRQTPFTLTATGSDPDGDTLTWLWEQFDLGASTSGTLTDDGSRPIFRPLDPVRSRSRTFPDPRWILNNGNVPPATAPLPGTTSPAVYVGEVLPASNRTLTFRVTARDNRAGGGGTNEATVALAVTTAAGPFRVTAPDTAVTWATGSAQTVTWDVAGTSAAPVSTPNVRITLSTDGGQTFPVELLASTPNSGSAGITVPANLAPTNQARIRVEAVGNYFFDVSNANFAISRAGNTAPTATVTGGVATRQGSPATTATVATVADAEDAAGVLTVSVSGAPPELAVSAVNAGGTVGLTATAACSLVAPTSGNRAYPVLLTVTDSQGAATTVPVVVSVGSNQAPTLGAYANLTVARSTTTPATPAAAPADPNNNLVGTSVTPATLPGGGTLAINAAGVVTVSTTAGTTFGSYPVRATATDTCGGARTQGFTLTVASPDPVLAITGSAVTTGNALIEPGECNNVNVTLGNSGGGAATAVSATLTSSTPGVTIAQGSSAYANIAGGATGSNSVPFQVGTTPGVACFSTINLTQTVTYSGVGSPTVLNFTLPVGRPAATNYSFTSDTATVPNLTTLLPGTQVDDAAVPFTVPAGFNTSVYGVAVNGGSTITISTNGNVQFAATGGDSWTNASLPATGVEPGATGTFPVTAPTIFAYWDDLNLGVAGSGVFTELAGTAPNRELRIQWRGTTIPAGNAVKVTLVLREGSNAYQVVYENSAAANGSAATIGVQAATTGTTFTQFPTGAGPITSGLRLTAAISPAQCTVGPGTCGPVDGLFANGFEP